MKNKPFVTSIALLVGSVVFLALPSLAAAATMALSPSSGTFTVGQTFSLVVSVSSPDQSMNAASGVIHFPNDLVEAVSVSKAGSIVGLWPTEPEISNPAGTVSFEGIILNPGFKGDYGKIISITFRVRAAGQSDFNLSSASVLANDGQGTNILNASSGASIKFSSGITSPTAPPVSTPAPIPIETPTEAPASGLRITSHTHPDENSWYNAPTFSAAWQLPKGVNAINYGLVDHPGNPPTTKRDLVSSIDQDLISLDDGVWYFALRFHTQQGWGTAATRKVKIDRLPPESFNVTTKTTDPRDPKPVLDFSTTDNLSGIAGYQIKIDNGDWIDAAPLAAKPGEYRLPAQAPGLRLVTVRALDKAGNIRTANIALTITPLDPPKVFHFASQIYSPKEPFSANGLGIPFSKMHFTLKSDKETFNFSSIADEEGKWNASYVDPLPSGNYDFIAQIENSAGALSIEAKNSPVIVRSWDGKVIGSIGEYTLLALLTILALGAIVASAIFAWSRLSLLRKRLRGRLSLLETELERDSLKLEKDARTHRHITEDVSAIQEDIARELKNFEKL